MVMFSDVKEMVFYFSLSVVCFICGQIYSRWKDPGCYAFYVCAVTSFILTLVFFILCILGGV